MKRKLVKENLNEWDHGYPNGIDIVRGYSGLSVFSLHNLRSMFEFSVEPSKKEDITSVIRMEDLDEVILKLPEVIFKRYYKNKDECGLLNVWPEDFPFVDPFLATVQEDNQSYIVDPEGSKYAKYIARLI